MKYEIRTAINEIIEEIVRVFKNSTDCEKYSNMNEEEKKENFIPKEIDESLIKMCTLNKFEVILYTMALNDFVYNRIYKSINAGCMYNCIKNYFYTEYEKIVSSNKYDFNPEWDYLIKCYKEIVLEIKNKELEYEVSLLINNSDLIYEIADNSYMKGNYSCEDNDFKNLEIPGNFAEKYNLNAIQKIVCTYVYNLRYYGSEFESTILSYYHKRYFSTYAINSEYFFKFEKEAMKFNEVVDPVAEEINYKYKIFINKNCWEHTITNTTSKALEFINKAKNHETITIRKANEDETLKKVFSNNVNFFVNSIKTDRYNRILDVALAYTKDINEKIAQLSEEFIEKNF